MQWSKILYNPKTGMAYNETDKSAKVVQNGEITYLAFPSYEKISHIRHGFSTRLGGVSEGIFESMNLSYTRGDLPEAVDENFSRICRAMGMNVENLVLSDQIHDTMVEVVGKEHCQRDSLREKKLQGVDGMVTDEDEVILCTSYADCVPLFFVDKKTGAIGSSHSGWKGTVGKIGEKTVKKMQEVFGTNPQDLEVVIGPSICQNCYEVSEDVYEAFQGVFSVEKTAKAQHMEMKEIESMKEAVFEKKENHKYQLDLWMANKLILMEAGVPQSQISVACVCTCCNSELLFSHRASKGQRGNLCGFLEKVKKV